MEETRALSALASVDVLASAFHSMYHHHSVRWVMIVLSVQLSAGGTVLSWVSLRHSEDGCNCSRPLHTSARRGSVVVKSVAGWASDKVRQPNLGAVQETDTVSSEILLIPGCRTFRTLRRVVAIY
ncbi:hypothetical protein ZHAS_00011655 [Anopheles sinensis]|uniref:Uncharacterized protein n=1 Tax=Anopheles sinensis TaxID=74873 RepID=A0A084W0R9_ANOSI|nr:hypothetical protein ZHAS_00011655 [Anopheles sinensis]